MYLPAKQDSQPTFLLRRALRIAQQKEGNQFVIVHFSPSCQRSGLEKVVARLTDFLRAKCGDYDEYSPQSQIGLMSRRGV